ncbi:MAG: ATP-binding cassette domain-containing protein [Bifidobacteriaceae bacterium]|jgi:ATPase subunit of ABC transporter with duplicated ATPase domains|nr:ATP-binding cassette domain-containing protein [Bifidobacteriaceae bacterium]MCI1915365.1 ATP-binding cassette domain-containing protein [Bifidobacteriaceae bacterium]
MSQIRSSNRHLNIALSHVDFTYPNAPEPLLENVDATFTPGWTAVLGDNGIGKTTLIRIALGQLKPDRGTVSPASGEYVTAYCPQETTLEPQNLTEFANDWTAESLAIRDSLGIADDWAWRYTTLSGGEKKRLQVACALAEEADVLVLDEPTNHVDADTRHAIAQATSKFKGIGILISHDAELIDAVAKRCLFFERRHTKAGNRTILDLRPGNYSQASASLEQSNLSDSRALRDAQRTAVRIDSVKAERKHEAAQSAQKRRGDKIDPKDRDAFAKRGMAIYTGKDGRAGAASARIDSQVAAAHSRLDTIETAAKRYDGDLFITDQASHRREVIHLDEQTLPFDPSNADPSNADSSKAATAPPSGLTIPELSVGPTDHIGVQGPNGTGKTTLISKIHDSLADEGTETALPYLFIPQETTNGDVRRALRTLGELSSTERAQVLSGFAQLNSDPDRLLTGKEPSPGELRKLLLCLGIVVDHPQLIIMDEPTNHLDLHSITALGNALSAFPGALILVSHDARFLGSCTQITWQLQTSAQPGEISSSASSRLSIHLE